MRKHIVVVLLSVAASFVAALTGVAQSADPVSVLKSGAPLVDKMEACRTLSREGTAEAVPALAPLLLDEKLSHMARYALEPMPFPEAGAALRDALGKTSGLLKVGIISSLATRKDEQAVPDLSALLSDSDAQVMQAAAKALGDIGTGSGAKALLGALGQATLSADSRLVVSNALLNCAEQLSEEGDESLASSIYQQLLKTAEVSPQVHAAALRGTVLLGRADEAIPLLQEALRGSDEDNFNAALRIAREMKRKKKVTAALAAELAAMPNHRKVRLLSVFGDRDGAAAGSVVQAMAEGGATEIRVAALQTLTRMGYEPALPLVEKLASSPDADLAKAARDSLSYFPGNKGDEALKAMLKSDQPEMRRTAVELVGQGGLESPVGPLMSAAQNDPDPGVRLAALTALQSCAGLGEMTPLLDSFVKGGPPEQLQATEAVLAGISERQKRMPGGIVVLKAVYGDLAGGQTADVLEQVKRIVDSGAVAVEVSNANFGDPAPGKVKQLRIDYTENGTPVTRTANENEALKLAAVSAPPTVVDAFCGALDKAQGEAKLGIIRLLGTTGSPKAFEVVQTAASSNDAKVKDQAVRTLCDWPTPVALPALTELVKTSTDPATKLAAVRGAVRLLGQSNEDALQRLPVYASLLSQASTADEKKAVLGGVSQVPRAEALDLVFSQFGDDSVKGEAVQAAVNIARSLGKSASEDQGFFNGKDLTGWTGDTAYWSCQDGAIVGHSDTEIPKNIFLWSGVNVGDFYLALDVQLEPNTGNAGIQFRSQKVDDTGKARGYQADVGKDCWGRLYHEEGRGKLDWTDAAEQAVKPGEWNHYEILAVGPAIWTAINGKLGTACLDLNPGAERSGLVAVQMHGGPPQTARYRIIKLVHNPKVEMEGIKVEDLISDLKVSK